jgi:LacI family transcriptional regulator
MARVTIDDISRETGLSRGTISRALNDRPDISAQTKRRVMEVCRKLNYVPSHAARVLSTGRNFAVAVLVDDLHCVLAAGFLRGVIARAEREHYAVHVSELGRESGVQERRLRSLSTERIDALLLEPSLGPGAAKLVATSIGTRRLVSCWPLEGLTCDQFSPDFREAGRLAARVVLRGGNRNVAYVHTPGCPHAELRREGFVEVCRERGLDPRGFTFELRTGREGRTTAFELLRPVLQKARAVACADDSAALLVVGCCYSVGRVPGRDVAVLGQGNEPVAARFAPALSSIDFGGEEIGRRAMELTARRLDESRQDPPQTVLVAPTLVERETTRNL